MALPIMIKATAVWLVDNTTLTFRQIAEFTGLHELEIQGIADGEVATGIKGFDPILNNQLEQSELDKAEKDPAHNLKLKAVPEAKDERKRRGPRYTPLSRRQDRPSAIAWLVRHHPELTDAQISKLVGTTKPTIQAIRERTHWNISNISPVDPVALGLTSQVEMDEEIAKAAKKAGIKDNTAILGETLVSTEESLAATDAPANMQGLENFTLGTGEKPVHESRDENADENSEDGTKDENGEEYDADSFFNLPKGE